MSIDTENKALPACPHCGEEQLGAARGYATKSPPGADCSIPSGRTLVTESWTRSVSCDQCHNEFWATRHVTVTYSTRAKR